MEPSISLKEAPTSTTSRWTRSKAAPLSLTLAPVARKEERRSRRLRSIVSALVAEDSASFRISSATTAKPFPVSPAWAASIAAFIARRLVWFAMFEIMLVISSMLWIWRAASWKERSVSSIVSAPLRAASLRLSIAFTLSSITVDTPRMESAIPFTADLERSDRPPCSSAWELRGREALVDAG